MTPYYADDHVTLYHARWEDVPPDLLRADVLVTDPPYGIGWTRGEWDDDPEKYPAMMADLVALATTAIPLGWCFVFQSMVNVARFHEWFPEGWRLFAACKNFAQVRPIAVSHAWDPVVFWHNGPEAKGHRKDAGVITRDYHVGNTAGLFGTAPGHPSPRPLDTMRHIVSIASRAVSDTILDPYAGSGTTLVAAKSLGRKAIGVECVERYCEVAANRLRQEVLGLVA